VAESDITVRILQQIREELVTTRSELKTELAKLVEQQAITNQRLSIGEAHLEDAAGQLVTLVRHIKNKQDPALLELRRRVSRLEKKVG
jgi:hypothetical protein